MSTAEMETTAETGAEVILHDEEGTPANVTRESATETTQAAVERARNERGQFTRAETAAAARAATTTTTPPTIDDALISEAEAGGLTKYQAMKLGSPDAVRRAIADNQRRAEQARTSTQQTTQTTERPAPAATQAAATATQTPDVVSKILALPDLDPSEFEPSMIERDKLLRAALQQQHEALGKLQPLQDEVGRFKQVEQEERDRQAFEKSRAEAVIADKYFGSLGEEFEPMLGRGGVDELRPESPYFQARTEVVQLKGFLAQVRPDRTPEQLYEQTMQFLYPEEFEKRRQLEFAKRVRSQSTQRGSAGKAPTSQTSPTGKVRDNPELLGKFQQARLRAKGLA